MTVLAVAALSARALAEAAARDGYEVVALDLFGDADTRRACAQWLPIGAAPSLRIERSLLLAALERLARQGGVAGWVAGSGFDGDADLLAQGAALLPLLGTAAPDVARVRDAGTFFACLDAHGIAHPPVQHSAPPDAGGWLVKDAAGCGGWHIRAAIGASAGAPLRSGCYWQREVPGTPMSATFVAHGSDACVLGFNRQIVRRFGAHPFVFRGVVGPVALDAGVARRVVAAARMLAAEFRLRGLGSLDFMLDGDEMAVLEVNPRVPASLVLYPDCGGTGPVAAHVRACLQGELPAPEQRPVSGPAAVRGSEIVFARRPLQWDAAAARHLAARPDCHDLPQPGSSFTTGDPVCSVEAHGANADEVMARLATARDTLIRTLERLQ